jgi:8-oxo-dGTP pyrophosphatase MutT (NUDIX family)
MRGESGGKSMETWDLYDGDRKPLGRVHRRGEALSEGANHIVVEIWTVNARGQVLLTRRDERKQPYPGRWENTGGAVLAGEESRSGALRELREETGIRAGADELEFLGSYRVPGVFADVYLLRRNVALAALTLQPGETVDARWATLEEIRKMRVRGELAFPTDTRLKFLEDALG